MQYGQDYFTSNNYEYYLNKSERYYKLADEVCGFLRSIKSIKQDACILDYGCAVGFLLDGLKRCGYSGAVGYDISPWACERVLEKHDMIALDRPQDFDIIFFLDVLEHMTDEQIVEVLTMLQANLLVVRIPCALEGESNFHLEISRKDPTHINCKDKTSWTKLLSSLGYGFHLRLDLQTIYDSDGVMCAVFFKTNA
jgi:SAM-dependent methyltransferase